MITIPLLLHRLRYLGDTICITMYYILVAQEPHFCIMTLCITTFWMFIKKIMMIGLFVYLFTCVKKIVCDEFIVYETNANLTHS